MMPHEKKTVKFQMMMSPEEAKVLDDWRFANQVRSRAEAIRLLYQHALAGPDVMAFRRTNQQNNRLKKRVDVLKAELSLALSRGETSAKRLHEGQRDHQREVAAVNKDRDNARLERDRALALYHDLCARIYDAAGKIILKP